ncbi:MAG TPA: hypothetical protein VGK67_31765 [Myxococcales bacterium]|jgi:hypothetical protein
MLAAISKTVHTDLDQSWDYRYDVVVTPIPATGAMLTVGIPFTSDSPATED